MIESLKIGGVTCDFMRQDEFRALAKERLSGDEFTHIVTLNPEMVMAAQQNPPFREALAAATWRIPDGSGLIWARWYMRSEFWSLWPSLLAFPFIQVERVTGVEAVRSLSAMAAETGKRVYLLGGTPHQVTRTAAVLRREFPQLEVAVSPAHRFTLEGPAEILADIAAQKPDIIFVAYGAPAQTLWIERHRALLSSVRIAIGVGGAFAILSEDTPRAPLWLRRLNLEWLWRLILEPSRVRRIWQATVRFPLLVNAEKKVIHTTT